MASHDNRTPSVKNKAGKQRSFPAKAVRDQSMRAKDCSITPIPSFRL